MTIEEAKTFLDNLKVCIEEHPIVADWLVEIADRKTESTSSKMEQVDKDINVRSKEPQTVVRLKHFKCPKCGRSDYIRSFEDWGIDGGIYKYKCINCNTYIKTEPQTEREGE